MDKKKDAFYITTTLPYVNARPHIGFAMEVIRADIIARYKRIQGFDVFFNTGTDEHGIKIYQAAEKEGIETKAFVDKNAQAFLDLKETLNLSFDRFIRTTDEDHKKIAARFWQKCWDAGYIYKNKYSGLYCSGCEMFITEKDLVNGECPNHLGKKLELVEEENYFFKYSAFAEKLLKLYKKKDFVIPDYRLNEIKNFVKGGLEDFSISRLKEKMPWGIPVPNDEDHVMYVWFDALTNYISTLGWSEDSEKFEKYWVNGSPVQYCGKDNIQQQAARWQAMLMSVGLPPTDKIIINGWIISGGQKMSKSIGNVIDPSVIVAEYGTDALRFFVSFELHPFEDSDLNSEKMKESYNANLANGLGNVVSRVMKMSETNIKKPIDVGEVKIPSEYYEAFDKYNLQEASNVIWKVISDLDQKITDTEPFKLVKSDPEKGEEIISDLVRGVYQVAIMLEPFMPESSSIIRRAVKENKKPESLFIRKD